jgi:hypothetical protein
MDALLQLSPATIAITLMVLALITLVSLVMFSASYFHFRRQFDLHHDQLVILREDLGALCNGSLGLGERLARMESRLDTLAKRQEHLELQEAPERSYKQAIRLVRQGANVEELMTDCGLARGEAELVLLSKQLDQSM